MNARRPVADMHRPNASEIGGFLVCPARVVAHIVEPGRLAVALDLALRLAQVAHKGPVARAVAAADAAALIHRFKELRNVHAVNA